MWLCAASCSKAIAFIMYQDGIAMDFQLNLKLFLKRYQQSPFLLSKFDRKVCGMHFGLYLTRETWLSYQLYFSARKFAAEAIEEQKKVFRSWGILADWDEKCYFTFDKSYVQNQLRSFYSLYEKVNPST